MSILSVLPNIELVEKQAFHDGMARLGAAVNIITTDGPAGRAGFTALAMCSSSIRRRPC